MTISKKEVSTLGFKIVAFAGDARSYLMEALDLAKEGNIDEAKELISKAKEALVLAHNEQTQVLAKEAGGEEMDVTFIMVHAQDTLMTAMMLLDEVEFMVDQYDRIKKLEDMVDNK